MAQIVPLDPATYERHPIHGEGRTWAETNCYCDVVIELLHGLGLEPIAALPFTLTVDFDVDQWTFFKFRHEDIAALYGLGIHELAPWRALVDHVEDHVSAGRPVMVELDSYYLPDTCGTAYKLAHVKSTVAVNEIDRKARRMGYFHNQGYHVLEGQDFGDVFQIEGLVHPRMLPPYIEFVKRIPRARPLVGRELVEGSLEVLRKRLSERPEVNPFAVFGERFQADMEWLLKSDMETFHAYSFATLRQYGACFELAATYTRWLEQQGVLGTARATESFDAISQATKGLQFQLARSMARQRPLELSAIGTMAELWDRGMNDLVDRFG